MTPIKTYRTAVRTDSEYSEIPSVVEFTIAEGTARDIIQLAEIVRSNDLYKLERFDSRAHYLKHDPARDVQDEQTTDGENDVRTDADTLNVTATTFWFAAFIKFTDVEILSERQSIEELANHFGLDVRRRSSSPG